MSLFLLTKTSHSCTGDLVCVFLGFSQPTVLRSRPHNTFQVVDECLVSSSNSIGILGELPRPWIVQSAKNKQRDGVHTYYVNTSTGERTFSDPRLGPLSG